MTDSAWAKLIYRNLVALVFLSGLLAIGPESAISSDPPAGGDENKIVVVKVFNVAFEPKTITVSPGTTVKWINLDPVDHDVTSGTAIAGRKARQVKKTKFPDGKFQSGVFGKNGAFEIIFTEKGTYPYYCNIHPIMQATVVVE